MEVVLDRIANEDDEGNGVEDSYNRSSTCNRFKRRRASHVDRSAVHVEVCVRAQHTFRRRLVAKVFSLVPAQDPCRFDFWGRTSGKLLVKADKALHMGGIGIGSNCL